MIRKLTQDLTVTLAAYEAQDCVGGTITFPVSSASKMDDHPGIIRAVMLTDEAAQAEKFHLYFFNAEPAEAARTDAAVCTLVAADIDKMLGVIYIADSDYLTATGLSSHAYKELEMPVVFDGKNLYAVLVAVETPDYAAATDLNLTIYMEV